MNYAQTIKDSITMSDVLNKYGFSVGRGGFMCCPFHNEKTASFKVYKSDKNWHCFGCGKDGDVISFVMSLFGVDYGQAILRMNYDFSLGLPIGKRLTVQERKKQMAQKREVKRKQEEEKKRIEYSKKAYYFLCCYRHWLLKRKVTTAVSFDLDYIERLIDRYDGNAVIDWDIYARLTALMSKHRKEGLQ